MHNAAALSVRSSSVAEPFQLHADTSTKFKRSLFRASNIPGTVRHIATRYVGHLQGNGNQSCHYAEWAHTLRCLTIVQTFAFWKATHSGMVGLHVILNGQ